MSSGVLGRPAGSVIRLLNHDAGFPANPGDDSSDPLGVRSMMSYPSSDLQLQRDRIENPPGSFVCRSFQEHRLELRQQWDTLLDVVILHGRRDIQNR